MVWIHTEYTLWYPPSNSDQRDYYNLTFLVGESLFTFAFDSDWVGRIDPRSNLEAPFCPWGGFPEALQSLLCYRQVLDKFLFSQPTSDSFIGYEGNNGTPVLLVTSQIPPSHVQILWEFLEPQPHPFLIAGNSWFPQLKSWAVWTLYYSCGLKRAWTRCSRAWSCCLGQNGHSVIWRISKRSSIRCVCTGRNIWEYIPGRCFFTSKLGFLPYPRLCHHDLLCLLMYGNPWRSAALTESRQQRLQAVERSRA